MDGFVGHGSIGDGGTGPALAEAERPRGVDAPAEQRAVGLYGARVLVAGSDLSFVLRIHASVCFAPPFIG